MPAYYNLFRVLVIRKYVRLRLEFQYVDRN